MRRRQQVRPTVFEPILEEEEEELLANEIASIIASGNLNSSSVIRNARLPPLPPFIPSPSFLARAEEEEEEEKYNSYRRPRTWDELIVQAELQERHNLWKQNEKSQRITQSERPAVLKPSDVEVITPDAPCEHDHDCPFWTLLVRVPGPGGRSLVQRKRVKTICCPRKSPGHGTCRLTMADCNKAGIDEGPGRLGTLNSEQVLALKNREWERAQTRRQQRHQLSLPHPPPNRSSIL
jgi:hypothetical protein